MENIQTVNTSQPLVERYTLLLDELISSTNIQPRDYQRRIILRTLHEYFINKSKSVLIEAPCASGKTIMAFLILKIIQSINDSIIGWTTMRKKLLEQAFNENINTGINADVKFFSMFDKNPPVPLDIIILDESHHDSTASMAHIYNVAKPHFCLGLTSTPFRSDRVKLCFNNIVKDAGIGRLIAEGWLSPYHHYTIPNYEVETVCDFYIKFIERWGRTLMYFHRIEQCKEAEKRLKSNGVAAVTIYANKESYKLIDEYLEGKHQVLINCMMLNEGFNDPTSQTVFCRPSCKSVTIQTAGRVFRLCDHIPIKNVVQSEKTKWPFIKTALPKIQYLWKEGEWRSLTPNEGIVHAVHNSLKAISQVNAELPKFIEASRSARREQYSRTRRRH